MVLPLSGGVHIDPFREEGRKARGSVGFRRPSEKSKMSNTSRLVVAVSIGEKAIHVKLWCGRQMVDSKKVLNDLLIVIKNKEVEILD